MLLTERMENFKMEDCDGEGLGAVLIGIGIAVTTAFLCGAAGLFGQRVADKIWNKFDKQVKEN